MRMVHTAYVAMFQLGRLHGQVSFVDNVVSLAQIIFIC